MDVARSLGGMTQTRLCLRKRISVETPTWLTLVCSVSIFAKSRTGDCFP